MIFLSFRVHKLQEDGSNSAKEEESTTPKKKTRKSLAQLLE